MPNSVIQGNFLFFLICYIQILAHRTYEMHAKQALYAYSRHDLVKDMLNLPDFFPLLWTFLTPFKIVTRAVLRGLLQAIAACLVHVPTHHGKGNTTALFCFLACLQRVGISSGVLYLPVQFLLCHHPEPQGSCLHENCGLWRKVYGGMFLYFWFVQLSWTHKEAKMPWNLFLKLSLSCCSVLLY